MTDILFITATKDRVLKQEVNGTMILATKLLQAGFNTKILRFGQFENCDKNYKLFLREITEEILRIAPKCISFYTLWPHYHIMLRIACTIKEKAPHMHVIFGGPQASATAKSTMGAAPYVDFICTGEGENTVVPFFKALLENDTEGLQTIPGLYYRENGVLQVNNNETPLCCLEEIPYWDERLLDYGYTSEPDLGSEKYFMPIDVGRGCPYNCTFCCTSNFWKRTYRLKSTQRIMDDIRHYQEYGINSFSFSHDAFTVNKNLIVDVCNRIVEEDLGIKWKCTSRVDCLSEELILKMQQAGMTQIELGIETGSLRMQKLIKKNLDLTRAKEIITFLLKNGVRVNLFFMYGFPEETEKDLNETLELMFSLLDMGVNGVEMSFCIFAPATAITQEYFDQLVLDPSIQILGRGISFGYQEELPLIQKNKDIFSHVYHLDTPVRRAYQYLQFLEWTYEGLPNSIRYLRKLYAGDNLRFYRDFYEKNRQVFEQEINEIVKTVRETAANMLANVLDGFDVPYKERLKSLICYDYNVQKVCKSKKDLEIRQTYNFRYIDLKMKQPIEKYGEGQTEILLCKKDGKVSMKILRMA